MAATVAAYDFTGVYVDANAISPQRVRRIAEEIRPGLGQVEPLFADTALHVRRAGEPIGSPSALKMAFADYQKAARTLAKTDARHRRD